MNMSSAADSEAFISNPELRKRGLEIFKRLYEGGLGGSMNAEYRAKSSDYADIVLEWRMGGVIARPDLDIKTREFIMFALIVANARAMDGVKAHAEALVRVGATRKEIYEAVLSCLWYVGSGRIFLALTALDDLFGESDDTPPDA
jgi:4-carboxymuconolactone decarboxylase